MLLLFFSQYLLLLLLPLCAKPHCRLLVVDPSFFTMALSMQMTRDSSSHADPSPSVNAIFEESTITPLRGIQHRDAAGNVISTCGLGHLTTGNQPLIFVADPDLSNPTRPRMERPLDTIKAFEKAIDNGYKRRSGYQRTGALHACIPLTLSHILTQSYRII